MKKFLSYIAVAIICLVIGFGAGFEYQAYRIRSAFQQAFTNASTNNTPNSTPTPATAMQAAKDAGMKTITRKVGDEIVLGAPIRYGGEFQ